ncbi:hypothetical protein FZEAL_7010 [Fusarium zealandicum]|uniref:Mid2 domain-containing protein n=1 Tax=Fusarium zealandicum TaxID=1053134 RepID=A0A8H4XI83_9HYPO|nr:hypothetical protein FZEAL_7010 [Fusarium zealandicum]
MRMHQNSEMLYLANHQRPQNSSSKSYCSMALLTFGVDQTYSYIACGAEAVTDHFYISPTVEAKTTSTEESDSTRESEPSKASTTTAEDAADTTQSSFGSSENIAEATSQSSAEESSSSGGSSTNTGAIVGGVIGGLVVLCGTAIVVIWLLRRSRAGSEPQDTALDASQPWAHDEPKQPQGLGGWGPQEMPGDTHHRHERAVELPS